MRGARCVVFAGGERILGRRRPQEERDESPGGIDAYYRDTGDVYERIAELPQPTFSAISGWCLGAGFELALATDFRIADETAVFGLPEVELGIVPSSGGTYRLVRALGLRGRRSCFPEAAGRRGRGAATGYRHRSRPGRTGAGALARARATGRRAPPLAASAAKQATNAIAESGREAGVMLERLAYAALAQTDDARAAGEAFGNRKRA